MSNNLINILKMLSSLEKKELLELNKAVYELLKRIEQEELEKASYKFNIGDIVSFFDNSDIKRYGVITKKHQKTFQVTTQESYTFNVPFTYLKSEMTPSKDLLKLRKKMLLTKEDFLRTMDKELNLIQTKITNK